MSALETGLFMSSSNLTTIPQSITTIEGCAFDGCDNLGSVNYTGTQTQWNNIMFIYELDYEILSNATINYNYLTD